MAAAGTWFLMVAVGALLMWMMRWTNGKSANLIDAFLLRGAALAFLGAGLIGSSGWIGSVLDTIVGNAISWLNSIGSLAVGTGVAVFVGLALAVAWLMAFAPDSESKYKYPDWLVLSGLFLPAFLQLIPGSVGDALRGIFETGGAAATSAVAGLF